MDVTIETPMDPRQVDGVVMNGVRYPLARCRKITFTVVPDQPPFLTTEYYPTLPSGKPQGTPSDG